MKKTRLVFTQPLTSFLGSLFWLAYFITEVNRILGLPLLTHPKMIVRRFVNIYPEPRGIIMCLHSSKYFLIVVKVFPN
jgi:hypothetical protein